MSGRRGRHLHRLAMAACIVIATATLAGAEDLTNTWEVGGGLAYQAFANGTELGDSFGFGVRGAYHFKNRHTVELNIEVGSAKSTLSHTDVTTDLTKWTIDYVRDLKKKKAEANASPFLMFGLGKFNADNGDATTSATVLEMGGGARWSFAKHAAFRFDGRLWHMHGDDAAIPAGHWFAFDLDVGVSFFIGGAGK